ncbi:MAG: MBL fold metallo-hydrolase [Acidobacteria bacterium]|nr:MAG: MBL fold metallo-hydrolase [Acidobacteriota bacterium]
MIACDCAVCRSADPRDNRLRPSIYVEGDEGTRILVDTTPDLRQQALRHDIRRVDAVLYTHAHADHVLGLDELRRFNHLTRQPVPLYGDRGTLDQIRKTFAYAFDKDAPAGGGVPDLAMHTIDARPFRIGGQEIIPVPVRHGQWSILGFRFGRFAYLTDCNAVPDASMALLHDLDVLVLDALRHRPHPTHFTVAQAVEVAKVIGARQTLFTHICHDLGHAETSAKLPPGIGLAYDGQRLTL